MANTALTVTLRYNQAVARMRQQRQTTEDTMATETGQGVDRFVRVGELNLHCLEWGLPSKPPVIMIHGLTGNAHNFDRLAPYFLPQYHVLSIDVPPSLPRARGPMPVATATAEPALEPPGVRAVFQGLTVASKMGLRPSAL